MRLGSILSDSVGEPCAVKEVEFYLLKQTAQGPLKHVVKAVFLPVTETERCATKREALDYLRSSPEYQKKDDGTIPRIPEDVLETEETLRFLVSALRDSDNPKARFVGPEDYAVFRAGLVGKQLIWLLNQYIGFVNAEYPEITPDMGKLVSEAEGK